jgi:hypothetical protein
MVRYIKHGDLILAIIINSTYTSTGIEFFTPNEFSQQLGYMSHPEGHIIAPHLHKEVPREVLFTKEVLFIKKGRIRVDFYDEFQAYLKSSILSAGDVAMLAFGGHGFEVLEPVEMIEVKQGPYAGESDKTRFSPSENIQIVFKD